MEAAMSALSSAYEFRVRWEPYLLRPNAPPEGTPLLAQYNYQRNYIEMNMSPQSLYESINSDDTDKMAHTNRDIVYEDIHIMPSDNNMKREHDIDSLSDKFDSIDLIHDVQGNRIRFDEFEYSTATSSIDTHGSTVRCRGPCIDVNKVYRQDDDGDTLLNIALIILSPELALYFINRTPHFSWLNIPNKLFQSALHVAVLTNQATLVRRLVIGGADLESHDKDGNMAIHLACRENNIQCVQALLEPVRYEEQKINNYEIPFQKVPQNLESKNYEGFTCLHIASSMDNLELVKLLVDSGADVNSKAIKSGRTVLHEAAWSGKLVLVKYLLSLGNRCNINAKTYDGYTAFDLARSRGHWSLVIELATAGANTEEEDME